ncbi:hypothetical protein Nepgr_014640 [Nepenthes gracilis]|uniref:Secreted protein n=1 Tax=Nepenthes gracilis TaxID=150966 RepID=A0AAD3SL99_NEPGR|nr:hypothetical protein Nepgr_014640 [Nepenthes gracilis]
MLLDLLCLPLEPCCCCSDESCVGWFLAAWCLWSLRQKIGAVFSYSCLNMLYGSYCVALSRSWLPGLFSFTAYGTTAVLIF